MKKLKSIIILLISIYYSLLFANNYNFSRYVRDKANGEPLIGANIFIERTSIGAATDKNGYYEIKRIKEGEYIFKAAYIGYKTFSELVNVFGDDNELSLDFNLNYTTIEGNEVIVTAQAKGQMSAINKQLNSKSLVNIISSERYKICQMQMLLKQ